MSAGVRGHANDLIQTLLSGCRHSENAQLTPAGAPVCRHGVSVFRARALIAPRNVHALVGAQVAPALQALVNVWARWENSSQARRPNERGQNAG